MLTRWHWDVTLLAVASQCRTLVCDALQQLSPGFYEGLCTLVLQLDRQRVDVDARIPLLSAVLGHSDPASTYWYLQAAPELFTIVGRRLEDFLGELP